MNGIRAGPCQFHSIPISEQIYTKYNVVCRLQSSIIGVRGNSNYQDERPKDEKTKRRKANEKPKEMLSRERWRTSRTQVGPGPRHAS